MFYHDKILLITGGNGFLGNYLKAEYRRRGAEHIFAPSSKEFDLRKIEDVRSLFAAVKQNYPGRKIIVIHLAASVGGIGANLLNPGKYFYDNIIMGVQLIEEARVNSVYKFVQLGTVCSYPKYTQVPFKEEDIWDGYPEETNAPYGVAKKALMLQIQSYKQQYDFNGINLVPVNLYGPNDNFHPEHSHVIPGLINKFYDATQTNEPFVKVWGTGSPSREFLYVEDAANAIAIATEKYEETTPINIGSGDEITIKNLVEKIAELFKYEGEIIWDNSRPDGQPRRCLDVSHAYEKFGFKAITGLDCGLEKTITWYKNNITNLTMK
jgi:GDP-L-fucose synthase